MINYDFSWWEDILLSWRFKPWSPEYGTDQENHETNRCSWYRYFKGGEYPPSPNNRICIATLWTGFPVILLSLPISCHPPLTTNFLFSKFPMLWFYRFPVLKFWKKSREIRTLDPSFYIYMAFFYPKTAEPILNQSVPNSCANSHDPLSK